MFRFARGGCSFIFFDDINGIARFVRRLNRHGRTRKVEFDAEFFVVRIYHERLFAHARPYGGAEADAAVHNLSCGSLHKLHERKAGDGFAAARLSHHAHGGALRNVERNAVDRLYHAVVRIEVGVKVFELHDIGGVAHICNVILAFISGAFFLKFAYGAAVFACYVARFACGYVMFVVFCHALTSWTWDQKRPLSRRPQS